MEDIKNEMLIELPTIDNEKVIVVDNEKVKGRVFTPKENYRLMGVKDEDYEKIAKNQTRGSQMHLAGDSIVTTCLMAIFGKLLDIDYKAKIEELVNDLKEKTNGD